MGVQTGAWSAECGVRSVEWTRGFRMAKTGPAILGAKKRPMSILSLRRIPVVPGLERAGGILGKDGNLLSLNRRNRNRPNNPQEEKARGGFAFPKSRGYKRREPKDPRSASPPIK